MTNLFRFPTRRIAVVGAILIAAALAVMLACVAAFAGSASASGAKSTQFTVKTKVNAGVLAQGRTVTSHVTVRNPDARVKSWWSPSSISKVVRTGVNGGFQMPYSSNGFRCTTVVHAGATSFTCLLRGGDVATTIKLTFDAKY